MTGWTATSMNPWSLLLWGCGMLWVNAACGAEPQRFAVSATAPVVLHLDAVRSDGEHCLRGVDGEWQVMTVDAAAGETPRLVLPPIRGGTLLLNRPEWMVLTDTKPPVLVAATLAGRELQLTGEGVLDLGCLEEGRHELVLTIGDQENPVDRRSLKLSAAAPSGEAAVATVDMSADTAREALVRVSLDCGSAGSFETTLAIADAAPLANSLRVVIRHAVMGISVSADGQTLRLSNGRQSFTFKPHLSEQLQLPNGVWAKLTTNISGTWVYPREFTTVDITEDGPEVKTARVLAAVQSIKGRPIEGLAELEFILSVRSDSPALQVTSQSLNRSAEAAPIYANWGWLPGAYYELPDGRRDWSGKERDTYVDIGYPGWLWLARGDAGAGGLAWMSPMRFGESRFDTMLVYSERRMCAPGDGVPISFAIALSDSAEDARELWEDLVQRGLLAAPEPAP